MNSTTASRAPLLQSIKISVVLFLLVIAVLRLTNLNYYLSMLCGLPVEVNITGGDAFNFSNYFAVIFIGFVLIAQWHQWQARWGSLWPFVILIILYFSNWVLSPMPSGTWVIYQMLFLLVAIVAHIFARRQRRDFTAQYASLIRAFIALLLGYILLCVLIILSHNTLGDYFIEFNDAFNHSMDDYGVMKQRHGYLLGFVLAGVLFFYHNRFTKLFALSLLILAGFGIRSFIIGMTGAMVIWHIKKPAKLIPILILSVVFIIFILKPYFTDILFDSRFYSFVNAYDIVINYPFGVGLGGYPIYTEEFQRQLFANFFHFRASLDFIPTAPESDLVHLFGSLGLIGGSIHLLIQGRLIWHINRLYCYFSSFDKMILFYFCFITFYGISEDSIFSINYWIIFGIASGIISRALYRHHCRQQTTLS